ncbi:nuclear transport factor 2 family protein [Halieaceae bacterium IMCC14734]|uniref:Nuclear transport factor 2 family protein n=1 Tax=Candidatus Litorirhabdus singularis TaxID=2518993 RepID=A0ABT3TAK0_9GAMM|nr:nuclear transport factor 2 family protein [Candidatus Litorirhabdus singularis]MCX2979302.1 nuclear transport factor 2 family protein [Candidatus Litorirhabdus singularis]
MNRLEEAEEIKKLKYRYFRYLDCKQFQAMEACFAEDATSSYDSGRHTYQGRAAILGFLTDSLSNPRILHQHHGHHPEIEITSETTATGVWYMDDTVHILDHNMKVRGNGIYWDEYIKIDGQWRYQHIGYERVWEYSETLGERELVFKSMFDDAERERRSARQNRPGEPPIVYWEQQG